MEPYDDYMEPDDFLLNEIRETVASPPEKFLLPRAAGIGCMEQHTVKAGGSCSTDPPQQPRQTA